MIRNWLLTAFIIPVEFQFLKTVTQRPECHAEFFGRRGTVPVGCIKGFKNFGFLDVLQKIFKGQL